METPLNELFSRDPLKLTDTDVDAIVAALRAQRKNFDLQGEVKAVKKAEKKNAPKSLPKPEKDVGSLNLDDLGL